MPVTIISNHEAAESEVVEDMARDGFEAAAKDYPPGTTEPHCHDYDVCVYVVKGDFRVTDADTGTRHLLRPGDKALVDRGTLHSEEHEALRMVVGRRYAGTER